MSGVETTMLQYGALGILGIVIYMIVRTIMDTYKKMIEALNKITSTLQKLQDNQDAMIRALQDITRRLENIERGGKI